MKISTKIFAASAALTVIPITLTAFLVGQGTYDIAGTQLESAARDQLVATREARKQAITTYFETQATSVRIMAGNPSTIEAMQSLRKNFYQAAKEKDESGKLRNDAMPRYREQLKGFYSGAFADEFKKRNASSPPAMSAWVDSLSENALAWQADFIVNNANPLGEKNKLGSAREPSAYSRTHAAVHPAFDTFREKLALYDVFLIDHQTDTILYTVFKELDFGTNLETGIASKSGLADVYRRVKNAKSAGDIAVSDFSPYLPSYNDQASFLAVPIMDGAVQVGVMAVQLPIDKITEVMTAGKKWKDVGLGNTGESYLIGRDGLMRTDSRFIIENKAAFLKSIKTLQPEQLAIADRKGTTIGVVSVKTESAASALRGESGFKIVNDYRGESVLSAYTPVKVFGLDWALLAEIDAGEALAAKEQLAQSTLIRGLAVGLLFLVLAGAGTFFFVRKFMRPVDQLSAAVRRIAAGDLEARAKVTSGDELQDLGTAFDSLLDERIRTMAAAANENEQLNNSAVGVLQAVFRLSQKDLTARAPVTPDVVGTLADSVNQLAEATGKVMVDVNEAAGLVANQSREVQQQAQVVQKTAAVERETVERMRAALAVASQQMRDVAQLAQSSNSAAADASRAAEAALTTVNGTVRGMGSIRETIAETEKRIKRLGERSQEIGQIVGLINTIAERTHVLSLNAAMQAAVAGDAGRGFAVVAEEVQRLAESARQATSQIAQLIQNIQIETNETVVTVNRTISQVVSGSELAEQSGERMKDTQENTKRLVEMVAKIATGVQQQLAAAEALNQRAAEIGESTQKTAEQLSTQNLTAEQMLEQSRRLIDTVSVFKLA